MAASAIRYTNHILACLSTTIQIRSHLNLPGATGIINAFEFFGVIVAIPNTRRGINGSAAAKCIDLIAITWGSEFKLDTFDIKDYDELYPWYVT